MQDVKSEYKVLAAIMDSPDIINKCRVEYFTENRRGLFQAMQQMYSEKGYITPEGLENIVQNTLPPDLFAPVTTFIEPVIDTVTRLYRKRYFQQQAERINLLSQEYDPDAALFEQILLETQTLAEFDSSMFNAGISVMAELEQKRTKQYKFLRTGLEFLDAMMGGEWPRKAISAVIANPGGAKTALITNSQFNMAKLDDPVASLFFSMEMSKEQLHRRLAANICEIDTNDIKIGNITEEEQERVAEAINYINTLPMYVIDTPNLSFAQMTPIIRHHVISKGVKVVFIDYLQIMNIESDDRNKELGRVGKQAKEVAKRLDIHICFISQRTPGKDGVWQIRDSGDFPAALDVMFALNGDGTADVRQIEVEFLKNREGPLGKNGAMFDGRYQRFFGGD